VETKIDTRPLKDAAWRKEATAKLITFLATHSYDDKLSPKALNPPTNKDFRRICEFLVHRLDATIQFRNFEEEFVVLLRSIRYPFALSPKVLAAVGSPHSWPSLLGALDWLVDLLNVRTPPTTTTPCTNGCSR
jgi:kinetochore protein NDC80